MQNGFFFIVRSLVFWIASIFCVIENKVQAFESYSETALVSKWHQEEALIQKVHVIGDADERTPIPWLQAPYVAGIGSHNFEGKFVFNANGWQAFHPAIVVTSAHIFAKDGLYQNGRAYLSDAELSGFKIKIAGCIHLEEEYSIKEIVKIGTLTPTNQALDWAVLLLDRPSCLRPDQLAKPLNLSDYYREELLFARTEDRLLGHMTGFTYIPYISEREAPGSKKNSWTMETTDLYEGYGEILRHNYYTIGASGNKRYASSLNYGFPGYEHIRRVFHYKGDTSPGNSGSPIKIKGRVTVNGKAFELDYVIAMVTAQSAVLDDAMFSEQQKRLTRVNFLTIYEGEFESALKLAAERAHELYWFPKE